MELPSSPEISKNSDCYFYYYSSCNKGSSCPYRHEPASLRNETMCLYWRNGSCNKPHCIYRHMEITKKRDKIPCFFESQPGGCKKLHCPFFHNNVLDQPREEDIPKNPDLILPVKDSEGEYNTEENEAKRLQENVVAQLKIQRQISHAQLQPLNLAKEYEEVYDQPSPIIVRKIIVPLEDGESDSESMCNSPQKLLRSSQDRISNADRQWELDRLREIQEEEGNLLGYSFAEDDSQISNQSYSPLSFEEYEEVLPEDDYDSADSLHRRLQTTKINLQATNTNSSNLKVAKSETEQDGFLRKVLGSTIQKRYFSNPIPKELSYVGGDNVTTVTIVHRGDKTQNIKDSGTSFSDRLGHKLGHKDKDTLSKLSVKERLGLVKEDLDPNSKPDFTCSKTVSSIKRRLGLKEDGGKNCAILNLDESVTTPSSNIIVKSLSDIKAQKLYERRNPGNSESSRVSIKPENVLEKSSLSLPVRKRLERELKNDLPNVDSLKIKTLAEIRAEKRKEQGLICKMATPVQPSRLLKRSISPIRFDSGPTKKAKTNGSFSCTNKDTLPVKEYLVLGSRKITLKKVAKAEPIPTRKQLPKEEPTPTQKRVIARKSTSNLKREIKEEPVPPLKRVIPSKPTPTLKRAIKDETTPILKRVAKEEPTLKSNTLRECEAEKCITIDKGKINKQTDSSKATKPKLKQAQNNMSSEMSNIETNTSLSKCSLNTSNNNNSTLIESKLNDSISDVLSIQPSYSNFNATVNRLDSFIDEEDLLLGDDLPDIDDEDINEDELLL